MLGLWVASNSSYLKVSEVSRAAEEGVGVPACRVYQLCLGSHSFQAEQGEP